jgi:antirestriction protein ArdC
MSEKKEEAKKDVYQIVTERIIAQLEKGVIPWKQPWTESGLPKNLITKNTYRGINLLLLLSLGYERMFFLTSKQITELGATVKKDEKAHLVVYWNWVESKDEVTTDGKPKKAPFLRYYLVYNVDQCEGIDEDKIPEPTESKFTPIEYCENMVLNMPNLPTIKHKEQKAYYEPLRDFINMPKPETFENEDRYYATLFHELVHSTGHRSRLNRKGLLEMTPFGSEAYSFEELIAEIGSSYLCYHAGIESPFEQQAAYIEGWLKKLQSDNRFIIQASSSAQKATDYILDLKPPVDKEASEQQGTPADDCPL